jgi:hypothetical protein
VAIAVFDRQPAQFAGRPPMSVVRKTEMGNWIAFKAVSPTLHDYEFRPAALDAGFDLRPNLIKFGVASARRQRDIQLRADGRAFAGFAGGSCAGIQELSILVNIGEDQIGIVLKSVVHTVTMMGIYVDVGNSPYSVFVSKVLDGNAAIIKYAKPGGVLTAGMVQSRNGHECATGITLHNSIYGSQRRTDYIGRNFEYTRKCRRIAAIEKTSAFLGSFGYEINVFR